MSLASAHQGYEYQDLIVALRLVDVLLDSIDKIFVDTKLLNVDIFDDLTTVDRDGIRERVQIKYTTNADQTLTLATFTKTKRNLYLDQVISSILADRDCSSGEVKQVSYRIVLTDLPPTDPALCSVLKPANPDPGPFIQGFNTERMRFSSNALLDWTNTRHGTSKDENNPFKFLSNCETSVSRTVLDWICDHLIVELAAPRASFDLTKPGQAERLLLQRTRAEVGAEIFPNDFRTAIDVATALVDCARKARQESLDITANNLLSRAQLRSDFGAVQKANPVDQILEVDRTTIIDTLAETVSVAAEKGTNVLIVGPPGQGKSWLCQQLINKLMAEQWLVAEHYCYLGDMSEERLPRVSTDSILGSLLRRLVDFDPAALSNHRPKFAADEQALNNAVNTLLSSPGNRRVALIVDGIDHATRVIGGAQSKDPSSVLAENLGSLQLPSGSTLIVLSQPGSHLNPLKSDSTETFHVPNLTDVELRELACRIGVIGNESEDSNSSETLPLIEGSAEEDEFVAALSERSSGNALYATFLCKETLTPKNSLLRPATVVSNLPAFDEKLQGYYEYIYSSLDDQGAWVADVLALVDFSVSVQELKEIRPDTVHRVDKAVDVLRPVLFTRATHKGLRIYHESFAQFLRKRFQTNENSRIEILKRIIVWLRAKGLFCDSRGYRNLLPMLAEANDSRSVVDYVDRDFVTNSIAAGFPSSEIIKNLTVAVRCAAESNDWGAIVRYFELSRSLQLFIVEERFESIVENYEDVVAVLVGTEELADRLLWEDRPTLPTRSGLRMCAVLDSMGVVPPWHEYMLARFREKEENLVESPDLVDSTLESAWLRGRLRLSNIGSESTPDSTTVPHQSSPQDDSVRTLYEPIRWECLVELLDRGHLHPAKFVCAMLDIKGVESTVALISKLKDAGIFYLALAEETSKRDDCDTDERPLQWAKQAIELGLPQGTRRRLLALGLSVDEIEPRSTEEARTHLLHLTQEILEPLTYGFEKTVPAWMDACSIAARRDRFGLTAAEALLVGQGWYRCWLRFVIALELCEADALEDRSKSSLAAIHILNEESNPFIGDPKASDLFQLHGIIESTILRAVSLLNDDDWEVAVNVLNTVCQNISTSLDRGIGGPVGPHSWLHIIVETATPDRETKAQKLVNERFENGVFGGYYQNVAQFRLMAAKLSLTLGNENEARHHWSKACQLLLGYGSHKDTTIYELTDPLTELVSIDPRRARECIAKLQPLCERIPIHTDGRGTERAWSEWLKLLVRADPCALVELIEPSLLGSTNDPNSLYQGARADLWRKWYDQADPILAGALRLTIDETLIPEDIPALGRLAKLLDSAPSEGVSKLINAMLSRIDERPFKSDYIDNREWIESTHKNLEALNEIAATAGASQIAQLPRVEIREDNFVDSGKQKRILESRSEFLNQPTRCFDEGSVGIKNAIDAWRSKRFDDSNLDWSPQKFANILGYRFIELINNGHQNDVELALNEIGGTSVFDQSTELLTALAEGFELHEHQKLAAVAFSTAWTRARGSSGWKVFGGREYIELLRRAAHLNCDIALRTIAREVERVIILGTETPGVAQALIQGFASTGLTTSTTLAFDMWDEVFEVVSNRAPRIGPVDDPVDIYKVPDPDLGQDPPGDIDLVFAKAVVSGLFHPGREHKRRTLVAVQLLIELKPLIISRAIKSALCKISDTATVTWLLRVIQCSGNHAEQVVSVCRDELIKLAERPQLVVRAIARRLLPKDKLPLPSAADPDPELTDHDRSLIVPADVMDCEVGAIDLEKVVDEIAGFRLSRAEEILPGLRRAVIRRVSEARRTKDFSERSSAQFKAFGDDYSGLIRDVFQTLEEVLEDAIQSSAAGVRAARLMEGDLSEDPAQLEDSLALALLDDPIHALAIEATRLPRPDIPPPPFRGDQLWRSLISHADSERAEETGIETAGITDNVVFGTLSLFGPEKVPTINGGPYDCWRLISAYERREISNPDWHTKAEQIAERYRVIEIRHSGDNAALSSPPITIGDPNFWNASPVPDEFLNRYFPSQPVIGRIFPKHYGIGNPIAILTPTPWLFAALRVKSGTHFVLNDDQGIVLALVTWRTEYETSDYFLTWPRLCGSGLVVRPEAFEQLVQRARTPLVFRDFLKGEKSLCETD